MTPFAFAFDLTSLLQSKVFQLMYFKLFKNFQYRNSAHFSFK